MSAVLCNFQGEHNLTIQGLLTNDTSIVCHLSNYTDVAWAQILISLDNGQSWLASLNGYMNNIFIYSDCGPNTCTYAHCRYNSCSCYDGHEGSKCNQCVEGYFQTSYGFCFNCSTSCLNNGTCSNQTCVCREGFAGDGCFMCAKNYYGSNCTRHSVIVGISPISVADFEARDGIDIFVNVDNVNITDISSTVCNFKVSNIFNLTVQGSFANETTIICRLSNYTGRVTYIYVHVSLDNGDTWLPEPYGYGNYIYVSAQCGLNGCGYGYCRYNGCSCYDGYEGSTCNQCIEGYFKSSYGSCLECSVYCGNNGTCSNQTCVCPERFTGFRCAWCIDHHYGPNCLQYPVVLSVTPTWITDTASRDGINITINGDNFNISDLSQVMCEFRGSTNCTVQAFAANSTSVICELSNRTDRTTIKTSISFDNGVTWLAFEYSSYSYIYIYPDCGNNTCTYGECLYGNCVCRSYSSSLQVAPFRGSMYGGYPLTLYGICFNDSMNTVYINGELIDDCELDEMALKCTMPMQKEGRARIQVFNSTGLVGETSFLAFFPKDDASSILANDLELNSRVWTENDTNITLHFQSNYRTRNYLFQLILFDYSVPIVPTNEPPTNFSRRRIDLGLGLMNLSDIQTLSIPYNSFISNGTSESTFHSLCIQFEMVEYESRRRVVPAVVWGIAKAVTIMAGIAAGFTSGYCNAWRALQSDDYTKKLIEEVPPCPRQVLTSWPRQQFGFVTDDACDGNKTHNGNCGFHPGATGCYRGSSTIAGSSAGAQCCYDNQGILITDWRKGAGTIDAISSETDLLGHVVVDVAPYVFCCLGIDKFTGGCEDYMKYRPPGNSVDLPLSQAVGRGDPHFTILNGQSYTFNGHGEYVLLKVSTISLQIQIRLAKMAAESTNNSDTATAIIAFVAQAQNHSKVQFDLISQSQTVDIRIDGRLLDSADINSINDSLSSSSVIIFSDDHQLNIRRTSSEKYHISFGSTGVNIDVNIRPQFDFLDLPLVMPRSILETSTSEGLLGDLHGLAFPNGTRVTTSLEDDKAMFDYGESWRLTNSSTLFTYALFDSFELRQDFSYKPVFRDDLFKKFNHTSEYQAAEQACQNVTKRAECIYDILITKDLTVVQMQEVYEIQEQEIRVLNEMIESTNSSTTQQSSTETSTTTTSTLTASQSSTETSTTTTSTSTASQSSTILNTSNDLVSTSITVDSTISTITASSSSMTINQTTATTTQLVIVLTPISDYCT